MTICKLSGLGCDCQPDEGVPCSAEGDGLKNMMLSWRKEAIRLQALQTTPTRTEFEAAIREAFNEGFCAPETYNDTLLNTADEAWEKSHARTMVAAQTERERFEAAAYRCIRNPPYSDQWGDLYAMTFQRTGDMVLKGDALDESVAAAMGWPTVPEQAGWLPIESAPEGVPCVVFWREDGEGAESERYEFDWIEDGIWQNHSEHHENYLMVGGPSMGPGPKERPPYTHFRPLLPPAPTVPEVKS